MPKTNQQQRMARMDPAEIPSWEKGVEKTDLSPKQRRFNKEVSDATSKLLCDQEAITTKEKKEVEHIFSSVEDQGADGFLGWQKDQYRTSHFEAQFTYDRTDDRNEKSSKQKRKANTSFISEHTGERGNGNESFSHSPPPTGGEDTTEKARQSYSIADNHVNRRVSLSDRLEKQEGPSDTAGVVDNIMGTVGTPLADGGEKTESVVNNNGVEQDGRLVSAEKKKEDLSVLLSKNTAQEISGSSASDQLKGTDESGQIASSEITGSLNAPAINEDEKLGRRKNEGQDTNHLADNMS